MKEKEKREAESVPLFEGQTTQPLSEAEKEAFFKKIHITAEEGDKETIYKALLDALERNYRTAARRFVREVILNYPDISFNIKVVEEIGDPSSGGHYYSPSETIVIPVDSVRSRSEGSLSRLLFHEMLHHVQDESTIGADNFMVQEAEANALSFALDDYRNTPEYTDSLFQNMRKWKEIVEGKRPRPSWAPAFKCLVPGKEDEARKAYIEEMAMLETQAQYIQDFVQIEQWGKDGKTHLPTPSYNNYATQQWYRQQSNFHVSSYTDEVIRDIIKRNPGLKPDDFKDVYASYDSKLDQCKYIEQQKALKKVDEKIEQLSPSEKKRLASKLPEEFRNESLGGSKKGLLLLSIPYVLESKELTLEGKKEYIANVIIRLKEFPLQSPTPERKYAIKQLEKLNGYEMPLVQNTTNSSLQNRLLDSSKPYEDETLPNMPYSRGGNGMA